MDVTLLGIVMDVRPLQSLNARLPIEVKSFGMAIEVRREHPENASSPIDVTLLGMIVLSHPRIKVFDEVSMIALQLLRLS